MSQMTPSQARVVDPILSNHARGYVQAQLIAAALFPIASVSAYGGKVIEFGKEAFRLYNSARTPGSNTKRIQFGYAGKPYSITPHSLEGVVPDEIGRDAANVPGINLATRGVNVPLRALALEREYEAATMARDVNNYDADHKITLAAGDRWTSPDSEPAKDIETGKEAVGDSVGVEPNTLVLSSKAYNALKYHPKLLERVKYTGATSISTDLLKVLFDVENVAVGRAKVATGPNDAFSNVWGTDAVLAYVNEASDPNYEEPSYGYTYTIEGNPLVEEPYRDRNAKSWIYPVTFDATAVLAGMLAGYLLKDAGSPAA